MTASRTKAVALAITMLASLPALSGADPTAAAHAMPQGTAVSAVNMTSAESPTVSIAYMLEEEKLARDVYLNFSRTWRIAPFANIAEAEQRHIEAIQRLAARYDLPHPGTMNVQGMFVNPRMQEMYDKLVAQGGQSAAAALEAGALIEEIDIQDLLTAIRDSSPENDAVGFVYKRLACGSRNHLRAFARNLERETGQAYAAQALPQATVDEILAASGERCGRTAW